MVQIIERRPDFIPEGDVVYFTIRKPRADGHAADAQWKCSAHAGAIVAGNVGIKSGVKEARAAFADAVSYARQHGIQFMVIEDPEGLFPPERRFEPTAAASPAPPQNSRHITAEARVDARGSYDDEAAREARVSTLAARQGLYIGNPRRPDPYASGARRYVLFADPGRAVAELGPSSDRRSPADVEGAGYQGTLDEIEAFLIRGEDQAGSVPIGEAGFEATRRGPADAHQRIVA